jgi:hypothetical protein
MQYKPIENCHMKNVIVRKDFNLDATGSFFHAFTLEKFEAGYELLTCIKLQKNTQMYD